jgi:hypothetical protein
MLQRGVERTRSQDKPKALAIESWLDQLETTYSVLSMDAAFQKATHVLVSAAIIGRP